MRLPNAASKLAPGTAEYDESVNKFIFAKEVDDSVLPCLSLQVGSSSLPVV